MDPITALTICGTAVAAITLWFQYGQYKLQRNAGQGQPGRKVDALKASKVLSTVEEDPVRAIAADHIFVAARKEGVGYVQDQLIGVYLDLHSAACRPANRAVLARSLAEFVQEIADPRPSRFVVATPREGNLLVGSAAAELLGTDFLIIRTNRAPRFGYPIEGVFTPGDTAALIDDLCMEGTFLSSCVAALRHYGLNVDHCICLFERIDGDAREVLESVSVRLSSRFQIDDEQLMLLKNPGTSG